MFVFNTNISSNSLWYRKDRNKILVYWFSFVAEKPPPVTFRNA